MGFPIPFPDAVRAQGLALTDAERMVLHVSCNVHNRSCICNERRAAVYFRFPDLGSATQTSFHGHSARDDGGLCFDYVMHMLLCTSVREFAYLVCFRHTAFRVVSLDDCWFRTD